MPNPLASNSRVKVMGFDDPDVRGGFREKVDRYKAAAGRADIVRIVGPVVSYYGGNVKYGDKGFFAMSLAPHSAIEAGDIEACKAACPLYAEGIKISRRFVVLLHHIESIGSNGRVSKVNRFLPWAFAGETYTRVRAIAQSLPVNPRTGKRRGISWPLLRVDCTDTNFQKVSVIPVYDDAKLAQHSYKASVDEAFRAGVIRAEGDPNSGSDLIEEFLTPEPKDELVQSLERAKAGTYVSAHDDEDDIAAGLGGEHAAPAPAQRRAAPAQARAAARPPAQAPGRPGAARPKSAPPPQTDDDLSAELENELASMDADDTGDPSSGGGGVDDDLE